MTFPTQNSQFILWVHFIFNGLESVIVRRSTSAFNALNLAYDAQIVDNLSSFYIIRKIISTNEIEMYDLLQSLPRGLESL